MVDDSLRIQIRMEVHEKENMNELIEFVGKKGNILASFNTSL